MKLSELGEPIYSERDEVDFAKFAEMGLPFWLAGSSATPDKLNEALSLGATGIQAGTAFAFSNESGIAANLRQDVLTEILAGKIPTVFTDPLASPSGFPFKVVQKENTLSQEANYLARPRKCDLGYLRTAYRQENGKMGLRCAAEPVEAFLKKGGKLEETVGRKCLCNGLFSAIGMAQDQESGYQEMEIMTAGDEISNLARYIPAGEKTYSALHVISFLKSKLAFKTATSAKITSSGSSSFNPQAPL